MQVGEITSKRMSMTGTKMKCSYCGKERHNKASCKLKKQQ